jgi:hypothetical protein
VPQDVGGPAGVALDQIPDEPRWLAVRAMLRSSHAEFLGGGSVAAGFVVRLVHGAVSAVAVVGRPPAQAIVHGARETNEMTPVLAQVDDAAHVEASLRMSTEGSRWSGEEMILHKLVAPASTSNPSDALVRLLGPDDPLDHLPPGLRHEMTHARQLGPVCSVFVDNLAASFCYPCWITERLWDVSIDTLEGFRGRALAPPAVTFMIDRMRRTGQEPVWSALESNSASLRLAAKLGFEPTDRIVVFSRGPWALLTGGFFSQPPA